MQSDTRLKAARGGQETCGGYRASRLIGYWALQIKQMFDKRYSDVMKVRLVMNHRSTHNIASLYETVEPHEGRRHA